MRGEAAKAEFLELEMFELEKIETLCIMWQLDAGEGRGRDLLGVVRRKI